jgi:hypothetical protein
MRETSLAFLLSAAVFAQEPRDLGPLPFEGKYTLAGTLGLLDATCILRSWRLKGVLACPSPSGGVRVCLWVENAWPSGILEVVRQPWKTHYAELSGLYQGMRSLPLYGTSASHQGRSGDGTSAEFAEARVYTFVPDFGLSQTNLPLAVPRGPFFAVSYISELDGLAWRNPRVDALVSPEARLARLKSCSLPDPRLCAGTWGGYYPRVGFAHHPSAVMAAYLQGLRAGRAASRPAGRVVVEPYPFEPRTGHYVQMLAPAPRPCVPIGWPLVRAVERGSGSRFGNFLFVHFGVFEVCRGCLPVRLTPERPPI